MEQLAYPIRQLLTMPQIFKNRDFDEPVVRMSDIESPTESFNLSENFKNISDKMAEKLEPIDNVAATENLNQDLNDLDFNKFVHDLSLNIPNGDAVSPVRHPKGRLLYKHTTHKETIIFDSLPQRDSDDIQVVKIKITWPKDYEKSTISVQPIASTTSTFKKSKNPALKSVGPSRMPTNGHHLPIMGKAALMNKHRNSEHFKNNDSEIIKELVTQRFQDSLLNYYQRSFHRQPLRIRDEDDTLGISSIASESMLSISSLPDMREASSSRTRTHSFRASTACSSHGNCLESAHSTNTINSLGSIGSFTEDMKFLVSTDAWNVETTNEINRNHSTFTQSPPTKICNSDTIEYDATQFLKDALGDELNNYQSTDASWYMNSIGTSNISALVSKADTQECHSIIYEDSVPESEFDNYPFNDRVSELLVESDVQYQVILQTSKALAFCRSTKEFSAGDEELEAERILLLATCKRDAIRAEICRLEAEETYNDSIPNSYGSIKITQIVLPPKQCNSIYTSKLIDKKKKKKFVDWYLCIFTHGISVIATTAVQADIDGFVRFRDEIVFSQLSPDFEIQIALYSMRVCWQKRTMSHETKYHLKDDTTICPMSPPRLFKTGKQYKNVVISNSVDQKSSYILGGQFKLNISNISNFGHFKMHLNMPMLDGNFIMDFVSSVTVNENCSGFLDVGLETGETIIWNRRWCTLHEGSLRYYNYPGEENPLGFINLFYCATALISLADRRICARPRTLLVETFTNTHDTIEARTTLKYFLAADSKQYMEMWSYKLNNTIVALRTWNTMKCNTS